MASVPDIYLSPERYLQLERGAAEKSEYADGVMYAMAGASETHNLITGNLVGVLWTALRDGPCRVFPSDLKVRTPGSKFYYPDVSVICGETEFADEEKDVVLNPTLIVEVLSDTTASYDRGQKFLAYQRVPSLQTYLLVSQDAVRVEHFFRQDDGLWLYGKEEGLEQSVRIATPPCRIPLVEIYRKTALGKP